MSYENIDLLFDDDAAPSKPAPLPGDVEEAVKRLRDRHSHTSEFAWCRHADVDTILSALADLQAQVGAEYFPCANCGVPVELSKCQHWTRQDEDGEPCCCEECFDQHEELGCPLEHGDTYRPHPLRTMLSARDAELAKLRRVAEAAREAHSGVLCLCAEGVEFMGKVALCDAIEKDLAPVGIALREANYA